MDKVQRYRDSLKYFEDLKKLREREDLDGLSDFFRSMAIRPTEEELKKPIAREVDNITSQLEAQNSKELDDMYASRMAGAGEFGTGEYKGPTKEELGLIPNENLSDKKSQLENTAGVGRELTEEELYQNLSQPQQQSEETTTVEDFGGVTKAIEEAKQRTTEEPKIEPLDTITVTPTEQQIIDANTPPLGDEINLVKKRESVGDTNYLQEGKTETENVVLLSIPDIINLDLKNSKALGQFNNFFKQNKINNDYIQNQLDVLKNDIAKLEGNDPKGLHEDGAKGKYQWLTDNDVKKGEKFPKNHYMYKRGERIAKEYYPDSFQTALNRAKKYYSDKIPNWIIQAEKHKDPRKLSESQQDELFFMDILQRKNSSKLIKNYLENPNDKSIFQKVYNVWHSKALGPNMGKYIEDMLPKYKKQSGGRVESDPYKKQPRFI